MNGQTNQKGPGSDSAAMKPSKTSRPTTIRNPYAARRPSLGGLKTSSNPANSSSSASSSKLASERAPAPTALDGNLKQQPQQVQSTELEYWERLPSRNVSFSPAEVLTISECIKDHYRIAKLYYQEGRSVRITGLLANRSIVENGIMMELEDSLATTTAAEAENIRSKLSAAVKKRTRLSLSSLSRDNKKRRRSNQRPWFASASSNNNSKAPQPQQNSHKTLQTRVRVLVDPRSVKGSVLENATVGSFVTVIGEFVLARDSNMDSRQDLEVYNIEARTLTVSGTKTNMVLYQKALHIRRRTMYERYFYKTAQNDESSSPYKVLQGCGPPPYDDFHRELNEKDKKPVD